jgi:hypothetical protein
MTIGWNYRRASFREHNENMRGFRKSHAGVALVNAPRRHQPSLRQATLPLSQIIIERGGARLPDSALDWAALVPVPKVASYKLRPN